MNARGSHSSKNILISFSGIDGAGKSTQIEMLRSQLGEAGLQVRFLRFWDDVATLKSLREAAGHRIFKGEKGVGTPEAPVKRQDKNVRSPLMTLVRMGNYLLDAVSLRIRIAGVRKTGVDVIICDRYLYDEVANLDLQNRFIDGYVRALLFFVPKPQVSFIVDADPHAARKRKPEYPLEFLIENRDAYLRVSRLGEHFCVTPVGTVDEVRDAIWKHVLHAMTASGSFQNMERLNSPERQNSQI